MCENTTGAFVKRGLGPQSEQRGSPDERGSLDLLLHERFILTDMGKLIDIECAEQESWCIKVTYWKKWFNNLEEYLQMPLQRKLSYSAEAHETWRLQIRTAKKKMPSPLFGRLKKQLDWVNKDWLERGCGKLSHTSSKNELLVSGGSFSSQSGGQAVAVHSFITGHSYRVKWKDEGASKSIINLEQKNHPLPAVKEKIPLWKNANNELLGTQRSRKTHLVNAIESIDGRWKLDSKDHCVISSDLLVRLVGEIYPHVKEEYIPETRYSWQGISDGISHVWCAMADACRQILRVEENYVLISKVEDWIELGEEKLSLFGLGSVLSAQSGTSPGEIILNIISAVHPTLSAGILLGAWERAEGRDGTALWVENGSEMRLILKSRRAIAKL